MSARRCEWCGCSTGTESSVCRGCKGVMKTIHNEPRPEHAIDERGTWHNRPGGIKVWISWDEGAA